MVFHANATLALELLVLAAGTALLLYSGKEGVSCKIFGKIVAYFTIIVAFLAFLCSAYHAVRYWEDGYFQYPHFKGHMMEKSGGMRDCPMMPDKMMKPERDGSPMMKRMMERMDREEKAPAPAPAAP